MSTLTEAMDLLVSPNFSKEAGTTPAEDAINQALQQRAANHWKAVINKQTLGAGAAGLGVGMLLRGIKGLAEQQHRNQEKERPIPLRTSMIDVPIGKVAEEGMFDGMIYGPHSVPWSYSAMLGAGGLGALGGWNLQDWWANKRRKEEITRDKEQARQEYQEALMPKQAGVKQSALGEALDTLADAWEHAEEVKKAEVSDYAPDISGVIPEGTAGFSANTLLAYPLLSGAAGAFGGYQLGEGGSRRKLLDKAEKERRRRQFATRPTPILVNPVGTPESKTETPQAAPELF